MGSLEALKSSTYLQALIDTGNDALNNLFYIVFSGDYISESDVNDLDTKLIGDSGDINGNSITLRTESFSFSAPVHGASAIDFMTEKLEVPNTSFEITKSFDLSVRLDKDYKVYRSLLNLWKHNLDEDNSLAKADVSDNFKVSVFVPRKSTSEAQSKNIIIHDSSNYDWVKLYEFNHCWISKITTPTFSYDSSDIQKVTITVKFFDYKGPFLA